MGQLKVLKETIQTLTANKNNKWCPPPVMTSQKVNQTVPKVYDKVSDQEFEVQIPFQESIWQLKCTYIEIKLVDQGSTLVSHQFDLKTLEDDEMNTAVLAIPEKFKKGLRGHKLMCTLVNKSSGIFGGSTKELHSSEVSLVGLTNSYQTSKQITYEKVKFDVVVRVRQAYGGKETEAKEVDNIVIDRHV